MHVLKGRPIGGRAKTSAPSRWQVQADQFHWAAARHRADFQTGRCVFARVPFGGGAPKEPPPEGAAKIVFQNSSASHT